MKTHHIILLLLLSACSPENNQNFPKNHTQNHQDITNQACPIASPDELLAQHHCLTQNAESGNPIDQYNLSIYYLNYHTDTKKGIYWLTQSAKQNYPAAQYNLAVEYWKQQNLEQALYWAEKAKQNHFSAADDILGLIYISKKEYTLAKTHLEQAAQSGNSNAMYNLGLLYQNGTGVAKDLETAISWYKQAADKGSIAAYVNLGVIYANEGKQYHPKKAKDYLDVAVSHGDKLGEFALANLILRNKIEGTFAEVESLLHSSANKNCYPAAKILEHIYSNKVSYPKFNIPVDMEKSHYFSQLAQKIDHQTNDKTCNLNQEMTF